MVKVCDSPALSNKKRKNEESALLDSHQLSIYEGHSSVKNYPVEKYCLY